MIDQIKIGLFLRELRKEKELTQEQMTEKFGVSSRSVSRWENGNTMLGRFSTSFTLSLLKFLYII